MGATAVTDPEETPQQPDPPAQDAAEAEAPAPQADAEVAATKPEASKSARADANAEKDEYEDVDIYTADMACKCGKQIAANAWFCPRCGRPYLVNMLFALVVLATGFALLNQLVQWLLSLVSRSPQR